MDTHARPEEKAGPDFRLVFNRVETEIIRGKHLEACRRMLAREGVWKRLQAPDQLRWGQLAQMAGDVETALQVFAHINRTSPQWVEPWVERLGLLQILGRREELAAALALCRQEVAQELYRPLEERFRLQAESAAGDGDIDAALSPFEALRRKEQALARYLALFSGREDCFARQWVDKAEGKHGYVPVHRPMILQDVDEHLQGRKTYGIYLLKSDSTVKAAVMDVDVNTQFRKDKLSRQDVQSVHRERNYLLRRLQELAREAGLDPLLEFSGGKGFHFWFFFEPPTPAAAARRVLNGLKGVLAQDLSAFNLEVFPKQDTLSGKGMGNLVKLPLGIHRMTGKRSYFIRCADRGTEAQLDFLSSVCPVALDPSSAPVPGSRDADLLVHPRWQKWAENYPELFRLERTCPPLGQIIAACREGKALSLREEKVLFQTVGLLDRGKMLLHYLMGASSEYNPHLVDFKWSRLRGTPLGCKKVHGLLGFEGAFCAFPEAPSYTHPLLHLGVGTNGLTPKSETVESLSEALNSLELAIIQVRRFMH